MKIKPNTSRLGFSLLEVIAIIAVVGILAWLLLRRSTGKSSPSRFQCLLNLKQVSLGFHQWATDPQDKGITRLRPFTTNFTDAEVSYFVGLDAVDMMPQMFLVGDCNFQIGGKAVTGGIINLGTNSAVGWTKRRHRGPEGNVALADGSVQSFNSLRLREALANSGDATNRLAIP